MTFAEMIHERFTADRVIARYQLENVELRREVTRLAAELAQRDSAAERSWRQAIKSLIGFASRISAGKEVNG